MSKDFKLPDLGEGVHEGQIVRLLVAEGDQVREDQPLMEVETDKAAVEIPSPHAGVIQKIHVKAGQVVNVGDVMVTYGEIGAAKAQSNQGPATSVASARHESAARSTHAKPQAASGVATSRRTPASPAVRAAARKRGIDIESINGSGPGGRVTMSDLDRATSKPPLLGRERAGVRVEATGHSESQTLTHPLTRSLRGRGDISSQRPPDQDIIERTPDTDTWGPIVRSPISRARKTIADAMIKSVSMIPHVTDTDDADITELDRLRRGYESPDTPRKLTVLPFVIRATALALARHPIFNASYDHDNGEIVYHQYISIAIGVHTERGLIAPVLRNVDQMSIPQIADELAVLAENARSARFQVNDTRGGTFTISNAGAMGGSRYSTPIINHPQSAVLALGRTRWMPWVVAPGTTTGGIEPRFVLPLSLTFDHRIIDGGTSIPFLQEIVQLLQNPARLLL